MNVYTAFFVVGTVDLIVGALCWYSYRRMSRTLTTWPDPGPWGFDKSSWDRLNSSAENMRVLRAVCLNTGASTVCCALLMLTGT